MQVPNPDWDGTANTPKTITRDYNFGAASGDLILVAPGVYNELVVIWKPVKLQGWGAGVTTIDARQVPTENIIAWRIKVQGLVDDGFITQLPGQAGGLPGFLQV